MVRKPGLVPIAIALLLGVGTAAAADYGDHVDRRFDRIGEHRQYHLDRRGDRIDHRLDHLAALADANGHLRRAHRLDRKGDRIDARLDRRSEHAEARWDRRGDRFDRRSDRHHRAQ